MGFLLSYGCVNTTVLMHHIDANKMHKWKLHKNAMRYLEQIQEATPHRTTAVQPLTSHLKNHPSKMNKIWDTAREARVNL